MTKGAMVISIGGLALGGGCGTHTSIGRLGDGGGAGIHGDGPGGAPGLGGNGAGGGGGVDPDAACGIGTGGQLGGPARTLSFRAPVDYSTGTGAYFTALGDLNGDGKLDLALLDRSVGLRVLLNDGSGTLGAPVDHAFGKSALQLVTGDLNGDGKIDVAVVSAAGVSVALNQGNASFGPPVTYAVGNSPTALALGDLNGDGRIDIAVANNGLADVDGDVAVLLNTGRGTFAATNYPAAGKHPSTIALGDLNGDCRSDLVVGHGFVGGLSVLLNNGSGVFKTAISYAAGTSPASIAVADLNGDGKPDLAEASGNGSDVAYVLLNYGDGTFTAAVGYSLRAPTDTSLSTGDAPALVIGDLNGDGNGDLAVASGCCGMVALLNQGDGTFAAAVELPVPLIPQSVAFGDLDGDGRGDLAVVSFDFVGASNLRVRLNSSH